MLFGPPRDKILIEGLMPERALLRLRRVGIGVYNAKKIEKNQILFSVNKKDTEKVFAIYPNVCYNISVYSPYVARKVGSEGLARISDQLKRRVGFLLGCLFVLICLLTADRFVFAIEFVGSDVYAREAYVAMEAGGIKPFSVYNREKEDWICSQLLSLDGVEYCSIKKTGFRAQVEIRLSPFGTGGFEKGGLISKHTGTVLSITALRGTPLKKIGDAVTVGETLVGDWFLPEGGGQVCVEVIARAKLGCVFEADIQAETEEEAFAEAYLLLDLSDGDEITGKTVKHFPETENLFHVKIEYTTIEAINLG